MADPMLDSVPLRRAVSSLDRSHGTPHELSDYSEGISALKAQSGGSQLSLDYLASMHGTYNDPKRNSDFNMCQHRSWFFLPWHRMYLRQFEKIICQLIGKPDWRLPYWDYTSGAVDMPPEFLDPASDSNPLFVSGRGANGVKLAHCDATALAPAYHEQQFAAQDPLPDFGSAVFPRPMQFAGPGSHFGLLEGGVHNSVHMDVLGMMADPDTAAWDPIFWLHHANIDRLWEVWLALADGRDNPTDSSWLNTKFSFPDPAGRIAFRVKDVFDTRALGYAYDDTTPPTAAPAEHQRLDLLGPELRTLSFESSGQPELIGSSDLNLPLDPGAVHRVSLVPRADWQFVRGLRSGVELPAGVEGREVPAELAPGHRVLLQLQDVTGTDVSVGVYGVYVDVPDGEHPEDHAELKAGTFGTFGLEKSTANGGGASQTYDITPIARTLAAENRWDHENVHVTFQPETYRREEDRDRHDVTVSSIRIYVQ